MKKKMKKWFSCIIAAAMVMSTVNLPTNILASDFDDGVEISVEDENEDAPEVVDSEDALNEKDGDSSESDNREPFEENEKVEENAENNTFSEFTDGTDFSDGEDLDISDSQAVGNNEGFTPRTTAPGKSKYYYSDNPFQKNGYGMWDKNGNEQGNCTAYAWGRAYEILGTQPNLGRNNAGSWWNYNKNNKFYEYGSTPKIGAVAVWDKYNNDTGHVAVVEAIDGNNVTISESHWKSTFFDTRTIRADSSNYLTKMRFLGYIYVCPDISSTNNDPFGSIDTIEQTFDGVRISGWAIDQDAPREPVEVHVYIGGSADSGEAKNVYKIKADKERQDIAEKYPEAGANHGYDAVLDITGTEVIYIYLYNIGAGQNVLLGAPTVTGKSSDPFGSIDAIETKEDGVRISGWAIDRDAPLEPVELHVYIGGSADSGEAKNVNKILDDKERVYVAEKYPGTGKNHGYDATLDITGTEVIYIYLYNIGEGQNVLLGAPTVNGKGNDPFGSIDAIETEDDGVRISGWAIDWNAPLEPVELHVYIGGAADSGEAKNVYKITADEERGDVGEKYPGTGKNHGYNAVLDITGTEVIYIYLYNIGAGQNVLLGAPTVTGKSNDPFGSIDTIETTFDGVRISGWAIDWNAPLEPVELHVYIGGSADSGEAKNVYKITADKERGDVGEKYPGTGKNHGYDAVLDITGTEVIYIYLYNIGEGQNILLGAPTVTGKSHDPIGENEDIIETCDGVRISGWAIDRDAPQEPVELHVYVGGSANSGEAKNVYKITADKERQDIGEKYSGTGKNHGYDEFLNITGNEELYVYLINKLEGENVLLNVLDISVKGHVISEELKNKKEATCITEGYSGDKYCSVCGQVIEKGETIPKSEHTWDNGKVTKEATCIEMGEKTYTCTTCQKTRTESIAKTGHTEVKDAAVVATCESEGKTEGSHCSVCGTVITEQESIPATGHSWDNGKVTKEATCTETGEKTYTCTACQKTKTESIAKTGHTEVKDVAVAATCESEGKTEGSHCSVCGTVIKEQEPIPATGHSWDNGKITKEATCAEAGEKTYTCTTCQKTKTESIAKTGHIEVKDAAVAATCESEGKTEGSHCSICGTVIKKQEIIPATGHTWDNGKITKEATCTEAGEKTYICTTCQKTKTEVITSTGHSKITKFVKNATCETEGYTGDIYCKNCGELLEEGKVIEKLPHTWQETQTVQEATCTEAGEKIYTCTTCNRTKTEQIPATGHKWSTWKKVSNATALQKEKQQRTCSECGTLQSREYGNKLKSVMKVNYSSLLLKTRQSTSILTVSGMAKGDYVSKVQSGNNGIVKVTKYTKDGKIQLTAQGKTGSTKVTIRLAGGAVKQINVKVQKGTVKTTSVKVSPSKVTLKKGAKKTISVTISPATSQEKVTYTSSNKNIAAVSTKGVITAKKQGTAKITVKSGSKKQIITVIVK